MKQYTLLLICLVGIAYPLRSQSSLQIFVDDHCYDSLQAVEVEVIDSNGNSEILLPDSILVLEEPGKYFASIWYYRNGLLKLITEELLINDNHHYKHKIEIPKIAEFHTDSSVVSPGRFYNCNSLCNGRCVCFYMDGLKHIEGSFKDGIPMGKIYFYNMDGTIERIEKYNRKGNLKKVLSPVPNTR